MKCRRLPATLHLVIGLSLIRPIQTESVSHWMWNKGCRKPHSGDLTVNSTVTDPAQCFEHCYNVTNSVAVQGTSCQCVENIKPEDYVSWPDCLKCSGEPEVRCGNEEKNLWSYYEKARASRRPPGYAPACNLVIPSFYLAGNIEFSVGLSLDWETYDILQDKEILRDITDRISTCIAVQYLRGNFNYTGKSCSEKLPVLCYSATEGECQVDDSYSGDWSKAVDSCVEMSSIVINSIALLDKCRSYLRYDNGLHWIGITRVVHTRKETTTETTDRQPPSSPSITITSPSVTPTPASITTAQQSILTPTSPSITTTIQTILTPTTPSTTTTPQSIITPTSPSKTPKSITMRRQSVTAPSTPKVTTASVTKSTFHTILPHIKHSPSRGSKAKFTYGSTNLPTDSYTTIRPNQKASVVTSKLLTTTLTLKITSDGKRESTTKEGPFQNAAKTRPEEKPVTDLNPLVARALVVNNGDSDLKTYCAAFGASVLVLMVLIALFLGLIHRSVRKLVKKDYLLESRFRHRPRTRSRSPTYLPKRERSPNLDSHGRPTWRLPHIGSQNSARYSAGVNNYGYAWDERYYGDDYHDDDLDNNVLNRNMEESVDFRNANRSRNRPTLQLPLHPSYTSGRRIWREYL